VRTVALRGGAYSCSLEHLRVFASGFAGPALCLGRRAPSLDPVSGRGSAVPLFPAKDRLLRYVSAWDLSWSWFLYPVRILSELTGVGSFTFLQGVGSSQGAPWCDNGGVVHRLGRLGLTMMAGCSWHASDTCGRGALDSACPFGSVHGQLLLAHSSSSFPISSPYVLLCDVATSRHSSLFDFSKCRGLPIPHHCLFPQRRPFKSCRQPRNVLHWRTRVAGGAMDDASAT